MKTMTVKDYETTDGRRIRALHDGRYIWVNGVRNRNDRIIRYSATRPVLKSKSGLLYYLNDDGKAERVRHEYVSSHTIKYTWERNRFEEYDEQGNIKCLGVSFE